MKIVFTKNSSPLSKLIRFGLNEPVSHVVFVFDDKIVFHSNLKGLHIEWFNTFKKKNEVVFEIDYDLTLGVEETIYQEIISANDGKPYDMGALFYFMWRGFLHRFFDKPLPEKNIWSTSNQDICVEVMSYFAPELGDLGMTSPYQLYLKLKNK